MNLSTISPEQPENPFERLKKIAPNGAPFWSVRELMPVLGYAKWEHLSSIITERVIPSLDNQTAEDQKPLSLSHIAEVKSFVDRVQGGGRQSQDFHISRFAAYLLAMNGDPRKPEIAAAQHYFAAKTREAELSKPRELSTREILELALKNELQKEALQAKVLTDAPKVQAFNQLMDSEGTFLIRVAAKQLGLGQKALFDFMHDNHILIQGGKDHNTPYQEHIDAKRFKVVPQVFEPSPGDKRTTFTTYVTARGVEYLRQRLEKERAA